MIASHGRDGREIARGIQRPVRRFSGAVAARVIEAPHARIAEHHHDWPVLTLYVIGDVVRLQDGDDVRVNLPAFALQSAGEAHASIVRAAGVEQIDIEFDPLWLSSFGMIAKPMTGRAWVGGRVAAQADVVRRKWCDPQSSEKELARATGDLLRHAFRSGPSAPPRWMGAVLQQIDEGDDCSTAAIAARLGLHPGWLTQSYRAAVGEGLAQTIQRRRVERATTLLRTTDDAAALIASESGFCDQSHMIRSFKRLLGRTPSRVRAERDQLNARAARP